MLSVCLSGCLSVCLPACLTCYVAVAQVMVKTLILGGGYSSDSDGSAKATQKSE